MALVYATTGDMTVAGAARPVSGGTAPLGVVDGLGIVLIVVGVGFKLAVVPFHMWTPDVYQGAPAPVTAFVATVSKAAVFALLLRFFRPVGGDQTAALFLVFAAIAIASMVAGNLLALRQNNVKRILAYSSIAHLGYLLVAFLAGGENGGTAATFYLVAYSATTLAAFGVVTVLSGGDRDAELLDDYRGLGWRRPWLAAVFAVALFSLAGIPLTAGFVGKFYLVDGGRRRLAVGAHRRPRPDQHDRPLLLHARHRRDVRAGPRRRGFPAARPGLGRPRARGAHRPARGGRRLSLAADPPHRERRLEPALTGAQLHTR